MNKLVSIVIPCYNAEKWISEAINSCLNQTYPRIEIIVVDDGSTDSSLEIIRNYGDRVLWETGKNRGANHARNRGFALSSGAYIQYLDADDYLFPEKIENQVYYLEKTEADVVYSDEKHLTYSGDIETYSSLVKLNDLQEDLIELFLSCKVYIQTANPLFKREIINSSNGWDETLKAAQDIDFFRSVAIGGAKFVYRPGCYLLHRNYKSKDRIACNLANIWTFRLLATEKVEQNLIQLDMLSTKYKKALAYFYSQIALFGCNYLSYSQCLVLLRRIKTLDPHFHPDSHMLSYGGLFFEKLDRLFGLVVAGIIYKSLKQIKWLVLADRA